MSFSEFIAATPLIILAALPVFLTALLAFVRDYRIMAIGTAGGLGVSLAAVIVLAGGKPMTVTPLIVMDGYSHLFIVLIVTSGIVATLLSFHYSTGPEPIREEYYLLISLAVLGGAVVAAARHFASFFLGLEILGLSFYTLIAFKRDEPSPLEAGIKYLIPAAVSDAFILFGTALLYGVTGRLEIGGLFAAVTDGANVQALCGYAMLSVGIGFKLSFVPFHMWTPDVYEGATAPVTALLATVSKVAVFAFLLRLFTGLDLNSLGGIVAFLSVVAAASMFFGNLAALLQHNVKRILAYSSIGHVGYMLTAFLTGEPGSHAAVAFYLTAYTVTTLGAFGVIAALSQSDREADSIEDYRGLARRRPFLAAIFIAMLLSLAGIPLTAGFIGKFYVMAAGIRTGLLVLVVCLIVTSVISVYYYLRIVVIMFDQDHEATSELRGSVSPSRASNAVLAVLLLLLVWLGVTPSLCIRVIESIVNTGGPPV
ncbi:MAG: NADH-quinone oxidoreductase subunit N [Pseudomonadota bacterium]